MFTLTPDGCRSTHPPAAARSGAMERLALRVAARPRPTARSLRHGLRRAAATTSSLRCVGRRDGADRHAPPGRCCEDTELDFVELEPGAVQLHLRAPGRSRRRAGGLRQLQRRLRLRHVLAAECRWRSGP